MSNLKRFFFVSVFILGISLLLWGVYNLSFKKPENTATNQKDVSTKETPKTDTTNKTEKISAISDEAVVAPVFDPTTDSIKYYSKATGKAYSIDLLGTNKKTLSDKSLSGLNDVIWAPDQTKVISKFIQANQNPQFFYYSYATNTGVPLKNNLDEVAWQSNSNRIIYKYYDPQTKERTLNISDPDGTNWTKLADLAYRNVAIASIPQSGLISFWNKPDSFAETVFESVPSLGGDRKTIFQGKFGADYLWSPSGNNVLVSYVESKGSSQLGLGIMNYNGGEFRSLGVPTFISKCVWAKDGKTVYYALPGGISSSAVLPNDYLQGKITTTDTFWKMDTTTGEKSRIVELNDIKNTYDATNLLLNTDESLLFFTNKIDGKIYKIEL